VREKQSSMPEPFDEDNAHIMCTLRCHVCASVWARFQSRSRAPALAAASSAAASCPCSAAASVAARATWAVKSATLRSSNVCASPTTARRPRHVSASASEALHRASASVSRRS